MATGWQDIVIEDRVSLECPDCHTRLPVPIVVTVYSTPRGQRLTTRADLTDMHVHALVHDVEL